MATIKTIKKIREILEENPDGIQSSDFVKKYKMDYTSVIDFLNLMADWNLVEKPEQKGGCWVWKK